MPSPVSATLYCIHPNGYLVDSQPGRAVTPAITPAPLRLPTLFASCTQQLRHKWDFFTHQYLSLDPTTLPLTWLLSNIKFDFCMQLRAMPKSCMWLMRLLCKLSNTVQQGDRWELQMAGTWARCKRIVNVIERVLVLLHVGQDDIPEYQDETQYWLWGKFWTRDGYCRSPETEPVCSGGFQLSAKSRSFQEIVEEMGRDENM
jgi:hypothetical protein